MNPTPRSHQRTRVRVCAAALSVVLVSSPFLPVSRAVTGTWTNVSGGLWDTASNWSGNTVADGSGFIANFNTLDITAATTVNLDSAHTMGTLVFGDTATGTAGTWILANNSTPANVLTLGGAATITVDAMASGAATSASNVTISAVIAGTSGLIKNGTGTNSAGSTSSVAGTGTLTLSGANTYSGVTDIQTGTIRAANAAAFGTSTVTVQNNARLVLSASIANTLNLNGTNALSVAGASTVAASLSGTVNLQSNSTAWVTNVGGNNTLTFASGGSLNLGSNVLTFRTAGSANTATIAGTLTGGAASGITVNGGGPVTISGDGSGYSGTTTVTGNGSVLVLGSDTSAGTGTLALSPGSNNTVTVRSSGAVGSTRVIAAAVTIDGVSTAPTFNFGSSTTGNLSFTSTTDIALSSSRTFQVLNAQTQFAAAFTGTGGITKSGAGILQLNGANTYTGTTTISAGTLALGANNVFAVSNFSLGGGTLGVGTFTNTAVGTLALTGNSTITLGSGGAFAFADSDALNWGSNTLSITGTFLDGFSIRFGTDATGLTSGQLALISINGGAASINSSGYLVASAIPEPATYAMIAGGALLGFAVWRRRDVRG